MYNAQYSNNPFIDDPTNTSNRYPDINTLERTGSGFSSPAPTFGASPSFGSSAGYPGYAGSQGYGSQGYGIQQQQPQFQFQQQQQQSPSGWPQQGLASPYAAGTGGYGANPISPQMTGLPYQIGFGAQQYGQQQQQNSGYGQSYPNSQYGGYSGYSGQQGPQQQTQYLSEFDPLQTSSSSNFPSSNPSTDGNSMHPREYIRTHKRELEQWDNVSWKQALNSFESLKAAWESTKRQIDMKISQGGYYLGPVETQRLKGLQKEAEHHIDEITASSFQMQEVLEGYRVSSDLASRNRVRESMNAALQSLPDWPPQNW